MSAVAVIPARWASTRFPGKPLFPILGKPLVQHTWERCLRAKTISQVIVATDDMRIAEAAFEFGAEVTLTSPKHPSGTDRLAEVAARLRGVKHIINVQGDEPAIDPRLIDRLVKALQDNPRLEMVTAACPFPEETAVLNPNNVKVVTALDGRALYFSRSPIPFDRDKTSRLAPLWHIGLYGYRRDFLAQFVRWRPTPLENSEKLEQLRALEHGASIKVITTKSHGVGVDTPEDVQRAIAVLRPSRRGK
jgi:3-deoxy-manno-octulosonate cytidylyltransferase (CMP-KDO synthetase)